MFEFVSLTARLVRVPNLFKPVKAAFMIRIKRSYSNSLGSAPH